MFVEINIKFPILIGLALMISLKNLLIPGVEAKNPCVDNNSKCNPFMDSCCDKTKLCEWEARSKSFFCKEKDHFEPDFLGRPCETAIDCLKIDHAICSTENKCICNLKYTPDKSNLTCLPSLGEFCKNDEKCAPEKSFCDHNRCRCHAFYKPDVDRCKPNYLGLFCNGYEDCDRIKYAECSEDKRCVCKIDYIQTSPAKCQPLLEAFCDEDIECYAANSTCINNKCQCKDGFISQFSDNCLPTFLQLDCKVGDEKCREAELISRIEDDKIFCQPNYVALNNTICAPLLGELCKTTELCAIDHSECIDYKCQCKPNFLPESNSRCLPTQLFAECKHNFDCYRIKNSRCFGNKCLCDKNHIILNGTKCILPIGGSCSSDSECLLENSTCIDTTCQCKPNYNFTSSSRCVLAFNKSCKTDDDCAKIPHSECGENKECVCKPNFISSNDTQLCAPLLNGYCSKSSDCYIDNSLCFLNKCRCRKYYNSQLVNNVFQCNGISLGHSCSNDDDCGLVKNAICSTNKVCICQENTYALNTTVCAPNIGGFCLNDEDCHFNNSRCLDNKCQCQPSYFAGSNNQCIIGSAIVHCEQNLDCGDPWHAYCSEDKSCMCIKNNYQYNYATCLPLIGGLCWKDGQCHIKNTACIDYHCRCANASLIAVGNNLCISDDASD